MYNIEDLLKGGPQIFSSELNLGKFGERSDCGGQREIYKG
jgi:hypothetical protein